MGCPSRAALCDRFSGQLPFLADQFPGLSPLLLVIWQFIAQPFLSNSQKPTPLLPIVIISFAINHGNSSFPRAINTSEQLSTWQLPYCSLLPRKRHP
jgi:hypothetical protein